MLKPLSDWYANSSFQLLELQRLEQLKGAKSTLNSSKQMQSTQDSGEELIKLRGENGRLKN